MGFNVAFNTVKVASWLVVLQAEETSTKSGLKFFYCKPPTIGKQLSAFQHRVGDLNCRPQVFWSDVATVNCLHTLVFLTGKLFDNPTSKFAQLWNYNNVFPIPANITANSLHGAVTLQYWRSVIWLPVWLENWLLFLLSLLGHFGCFGVSFQFLLPWQGNKIKIDLLLSFSDSVKKILGLMQSFQCYSERSEYTAGPGPINILSNQVSPAQSVRNLWVVFDSNFSFSDHVSQIIKSTRVHARDLYRILSLLDLHTSVLFANALVSSRLDYCNSLFLPLTDFELRRLQLVQNSLCRVVTRFSKYSHITPQLKKLHWLPVKYRVQFKIGLITYKILNQGQPVYLRELIHPYTSSRNTRQSTPKLKFLHTPTFDRKVHKSSKHFPILSVTMPWFFRTPSK